MPNRIDEVPSSLVEFVTTDPSPGGGPSQHYHEECKGLYFMPGYTVRKEWAEPIGGKSTGRAWKAFQHYKLTSGSGGGQSVEQSIDTGHSNSDLDLFRVNGPYVAWNGYPGALGEPNSGLPEFYSTEGITVPSECGPYLRQHALNAMMPYVKNELSLINSIIELKDFASLKGRIRSMRGLVIKVERFVKTLRNNKVKNLRHLLRLMAGDYLQYKFAIAPLVSDIQAVSTALSKFRRRLNDRVNRAGGTRTAHFTRAIQVDPPQAWSTSTGAANPVPLWAPVEGVYAGQFNVPASYYHTRVVYNDPVLFHAELKYNYHYAQYQIEHARLLGLLDGLGLNLNPAIIWNALPWSFVVDWVTNVNSWLDKTKIGNMDPQVNIQDFLWSIKRRRTIEVRTKVLYNRYYSGWPEQDVSIGGALSRPLVEEVAYGRFLSMPTRNMLEQSGLDSNELTLGTALVLVRR